LQRLQGFFDLAREAYPCSERAAPRYEVHWEDIASELSWLQDVLPSERNEHGAALLGNPDDATAAARHIFRSVFCHNDLLSGNFLLDSDAALFKEGGVGSSAAEVEAAALSAAARQRCAGHGAVGCGSCVTPVPAGASPHPEHSAAAASPAHADPRSAAARPRLVLIDYEYANTNYAAYDLANHLCEHAGFAFDLAADFPAPALRKSLLRLYVNACAKHEGRSGHGSGSAGSAPPPGAGGASTTWSDAQVEVMTEWVDRFLLASHFWWGLWALVQARHSPIDFDFEGYAIKRLRGYALHKAEFWPGAPVRALFREL
jgi:thiamine kinase-like enzyme